MVNGGLCKGAEAQMSRTVLVVMGGRFVWVLVMQRYRTDDDLKCSRVWNSDSSTAQYLYCNQRVKGILGGFQPHNAPVNST